MISKINSTISLNRNCNCRSQISFKSCATSGDDIKVYSKDIRTPVSSKSGNIDICYSKIYGPVSNMSGDIDIMAAQINGSVSNISGEIDITGSQINGSVSNISGDMEISNSKVKGSVKNTTGKVKISKNSEVNGNINNVIGSITLEDSFLTGNMLSTNGEILIRNSVVDGIITAKPESIKLRGNNRIEELVLQDYKKINIMPKSNIKTESAKNGFKMRPVTIIKNSYGTMIYHSDIQNTSQEKQLEFKLPKNTTINTIKFDSDKPGVLILENGAKFFGRIINGSIKGQSNSNSDVVNADCSPRADMPKRKNNSSKKAKNTNISPKSTQLDNSDCELKTDIESVGPEQSEVLSDKEDEKKIFIELNWDDIPLESDATDLPSRKYQYSSTFRDEELFDPEMDELTSPRNLQYSIDDVRLRDDLWMEDSDAILHHNQDCTGFYPETSTRDEMLFYQTVHSPWITISTDLENQKKETELNIFMDMAREKIKKINDDYRLPSKIFKNCTILRNGKNEYDINLCKLALDLFKSSEEWNEVENQIIDEVRIPIYGKTYGNISAFKYKRAENMVYVYSNQKILEHLKKISLLDVYGIRDLAE